MEEVTAAMWTHEKAHTKALVECLREMDFDMAASQALSEKLHYRVTTGEIASVASFIERLMDERENMATKQTNPTDTTQAQQPRQPELMVGRIVHYTDNAEECRAAIVTHVPLGEDGKPEADGLCSLVWFDYQPHAAGNVRYKSVVSDDPAAHTWHEVH